MDDTGLVVGNTYYYRIRAVYSDVPSAWVMANAAVPALQPEIAVDYKGTDIANGDISPSTLDGTDFGSITQGGATVSRTYTVTNDGGSTLELATPTVPFGFTLTEVLASVLGSGESDTFTVRLDNATTGTKAVMKASEGSGRERSRRAEGRSPESEVEAHGAGS